MPKVSILLPHFQTLELTLLCLRLIRRKTAMLDYETIVIDNGSTDGSGAALAQLTWPRFVRRECSPGERPARSHGLALNLGVEQSRAPLVLIMHTDTMVIREDWLGLLVDALESGGPRCACVGSWKMEAHGRLHRLGKWFEQAWKRCTGRRLSQPRYVRSHCALYRKEAIQSYPRMFDPSEDRSAGEELFKAMNQNGWTYRFLAPEVLCRYVCHLNHATMALNTEFGRNDPYMPRTRARAMRRIREFFDTIRAEEILADTSLDCASGR